MPTLFDPIRIGAIEPPNRILMAPLTPRHAMAAGFDGADAGVRSSMSRAVLRRFTVEGGAAHVATSTSSPLCSPHA